MTGHATPDRAADLLRRWNRAASSLGLAGSEFHNEPELVFARGRQWRDELRRMKLDRAKEATRS